MILALRTAGLLCLGLPLLLALLTSPAERMAFIRTFPDRGIETIEGATQAMLAGFVLLTLATLNSELRKQTAKESS